MRRNNCSSRMLLLLTLFMLPSYGSLKSLGSISSAINLKWNGHVTRLTWTPLPRFLPCGFLKDSIYKSRPCTMAVFKADITENIQVINQKVWSVGLFCRLFIAESSLYVYIKYMWFGLVGLYDISTIVGNLMPNPLYIYIYIYIIWFGWVLWHINHCLSFNANSSLYIYIKYIWFGWFGLCGISTITVYLIPNALYTCILNIYDHHNHHHHVVPPARISLTLSRHFSLSFIASGRSSGLHPVSSHSCCM